MFSCVLGERAGLLRSWFMYFPTSPKWESCWGQCKVLSLTTSPGSFPAPVSLPGHRFCSWHNTGRGGASMLGLGSSRWHEEAPAEEGLPMGAPHPAPLSPSAGNTPCLFVLQILVFRPEPPWPLHLLEGLHDSFLTLQGPWLFMIWPILIHLLPN